MAAIKDDVKLFIVKALACYQEPMQIIEDVKLNFGIDVTRQQLQAYNPGTVAGARLGRKWKDIFKDTRVQYLRDISSIPISQMAYRLRALQREYDRVARQKNTQLAAQILKQAAKEVGGFFTNCRKSA